MTPTDIASELASIKRMLKQILEVNKPEEWISEKEAMHISRRGKTWLRNQRMGNGDVPATLIEGKDWRRVNGRTPEYKKKSIEWRKSFSNARNQPTEP
jgi:hypothetical protein